MGASPILLILGAGPKVGSAVAKAFASKGYRVALAARSLSDSSGSTEKELHINVDLNKPETVPGVFQKIKKVWGQGPNVVVYNGASAHMGSPQDPLDKFNLGDFTTDMNVNATSVVVAAKEAVDAFRELNKPSIKKVFIMTGNILALKALPQFATFAMGKGASARLIDSLSKAYTDEGFRFYFADERNAEGGPVPKTDGPTHADAFVKLAEADTQLPWYYTFTKGQNGEYAKF